MRAWIATLRPGQIYAARTHRVISFHTLVRRLKQARVVFVGEQHTHRGHHEVQARIISALADGPALSVGLEMLKRGTAGRDLDDYTAGRTTERRFVRRVRWYRRWGYDYRYYRPVFQAARRHRLSIFGINVSRKIVRKVGRQGLAALARQTRAQLPRVYLGSKEHRTLFRVLLGLPVEPRGGRRLRHPHGRYFHESRMDRLYQAQSLWDEYMADTIIRTLRERPYPARRIVALAGSGHLYYGLGINMRLRRRWPALPQATVICVSVGSTGAVRVVRGLADFIWATEKPSARTSFPSLGMRLGPSETGMGASVRGFPFGHSAARKAGLRRGDLIVRMDGKPVSAPFDLRWYMQTKNWGDRLTLTIRRKGKQLARTMAFNSRATAR